MKYGGSSPSAVPIPHKTASSWIWGKMLVSGILEPSNDEYIGGPNAVQFLSSHEGPLYSWIVSYTELFISTRPHCTALIVNRAICGPKYRTNVCRPDPAEKKRFKISKTFHVKSLEQDQMNQDHIRKRDKNPFCGSICLLNLSENWDYWPQIPWKMSKSFFMVHAI